MSLGPPNPTPDMKIELSATPTSPLLDGTASEQLAYFENQILAARNVEREIGQALLQIKSRKLFKVYGLNFGDYCKARFNFQKSRAYQLVKFAKACAAASAAGELPPRNERAFRETVARHAGKGSRSAEEARLQKNLRDAVMAQPPDERIIMIQNLQIFLGRFAKDLAANQPLTQPISAAPTPEVPVQKASPLLASAENSAIASITSERMVNIAEAKTPAEKVTNPEPPAEPNLATIMQASQGLGGVASMTIEMARQLGLAR